MTITTFAELAEISLLTSEQHDKLWSDYYALAPEGDGVDADKRDAMLALIKTAPSSITRLMPHAGVNEFVGYFAWCNDEGALHGVAISLCEDNDTCMCDIDEPDLAWYYSTEVKDAA